LESRREHFKGNLNSVKVTNDDTYERICFGKEEIFTARENTMAIRWLKSGKTASEDKIRSEMLKALNSEGIIWLTRV